MMLDRIKQRLRCGVPLSNAELAFLLKELLEKYEVIEKRLAKKATKDAERSEVSSSRGTDEVPKELVSRKTKV